MNRELISFIQIVLAIILIALILLQTKGSGLGSTFGGELGLYQTRRGVEKILFRSTIIVATLFLGTAIAGFLM